MDIFNVIIFNFTNITTWAYSMSLYSTLRIPRHDHIQCHRAQFYEYHDMNNIFNIIALNFTNITTWTYSTSSCSTLWISRPVHILCHRAQFYKYHDMAYSMSSYSTLWITPLKIHEVIMRLVLRKMFHQLINNILNVKYSISRVVSICRWHDMFTRLEEGTATF